MKWISMMLLFLGTGCSVHVHFSCEGIVSPCFVAKRIELDYQRRYK